MTRPSKTNTSNQIMKILAYIRDVIIFFVKWKFRFSFYRVIISYGLCIALIIGGCKWSINGHVKSDTGAEIDNFSISNSNADKWTVLLCLIVTLLYIVVLYYRDREEIRKFAHQKQNKDFFAAIYLPYFKNVFELLDAANYKYWAYSICVSGNCRIPIDRYCKLRDLINYCDQCQCIDGYESYYMLIKNLRDVLNDLLNVFDLHSRKFGNDMYEFHKFYKDHIYNNYTQIEEEEWEAEILLISDLTFELTCVANLLLSKIREFEPGFLAEFGILTIVDAVSANNEKKDIVYRNDEISDNPYPGLKEFLLLRESRQFHYGKGNTLEPILKRCYIIR